MTPTKILLVESVRITNLSYSSILLKKGFALFVENMPRRIVERIRATEPDVVVVDAVSLRVSGVRICQNIHSQIPDCSIILISHVKGSTPAAAGASAILKPPFTNQRLLHAVRRLLPNDEDNWLQAGPIRLNMDLRKVVCGEREAHITPKEVRLLEIFLRHPNMLLTRKFLIKTVWDTDFTGDTRTLDVHVSWLREVIEPDPSSPRYLHTLRGQGYRLDIPESTKKRAPRRQNF
jgi:DNA-binding response OmpR family regulator